MYLSLRTLFEYQKDMEYLYSLKDKFPDSNSPVEVHSSCIYKDMLAVHAVETAQIWTSKALPTKVQYE